MFHLNSRKSREKKNKSYRLPISYGFFLSQGLDGLCLVTVRLMELSVMAYKVVPVSPKYVLQSNCYFTN